MLILALDRQRHRCSKVDENCRLPDKCGLHEQVLVEDDNNAISHVLEIIEAARRSQDTGMRIRLKSKFPWPMVK